jgi:hypothetical protein
MRILIDAARPWLVWAATLALLVAVAACNNGSSGSGY